MDFTLFLCVLLRGAEVIIENCDDFYSIFKIPFKEILTLHQN